MLRLHALASAAIRQAQALRLQGIYPNPYVLPEGTHLFQARLATAPHRGRSFRSRASRGALRLFFTGRSVPTPPHVGAYDSWWRRLFLSAPRLGERSSATASRRRRPSPRTSLTRAILSRQSSFAEGTPAEAEKRSRPRCVEYSDNLRTICVDYTVRGFSFPFELFASENSRFPLRLGVWPRLKAARLARNEKPRAPEGSGGATPTPGLAGAPWRRGRG
jgi:hypothetical protein